MRIALLIAVLAAPLAAQDPPTKTPTFKTEFTLRIEGAAGSWAFVLEGTTDLPDGAVLKARLFAVEEVDDFKGGKRLDEESLIQEHRGWRRHVVKGGKIKERLLESSRKPYSIWYRGRLTYDPDVQENAILAAAGEKKLDWDADLRHGTPADFEKELAVTLKSLTTELEEVQSMFRDLRGRFQVWTRAPNPPEFTAWRKGFVEKVERIRKDNESRYSIWIVWLERQAKFRFSSFTDRFEMLCVEFEEWMGLKAKVTELSRDPKKNEKELAEVQESETHTQLRVMHGLTGFLAYFEEAREALGIDTPSDPDVVDAILKSYEAATAELAALAGKGDASAWKAGAPAARLKARQALMKLSVPTLLPRRGYDRVLELADKFADLYALQEKMAAGEKPPPDSKTAEEHQSILADFRKKYGGTP